MNIFWLDFDFTKCAQYHCDKHVIKMILELAQLLCTAHRILDGNMIEEEYVTKSNKKRKRKVYKLDSEQDTQLYKATHVNHPCAKWVRECDKNYDATYNLFVALCAEYTHRYGKIHKCQEKFQETLASCPSSIPRTDEMTTPALAMPDECKVDASVTESYRNYYKSDGKKHIVTWNKNRPAPEWFNA